MRAVVAEGLSRSFGATRAVEAVSLSIEPGTLFGLIGPDGAGKTTLIRMLISLLLPDGGSARVLGLDIVKEYRELRKRVGYMPGRFSLYPDLTVEENLTFFASVFGTTLRQGYDLIEGIYRHLEPFKHRQASALSGGMKQKLALSCALVHQPDMLFLDEPTTGVDAVSRKEFWDTLTGLKERGITIVVSTPYMDEAVRCEQVALMQAGRILRVDVPAHISEGFPHPLLAVRGADRHRLIQVLRGYRHTLSVYAFGEWLHYADARDRADPDELMAFLTGEGLPGIEIKPIAAGIEDMFMKLMQPESVEKQAI